MTGWILAVLALFFVQTLLPSAARASTGLPEQLAWLRGNRDHRPPAPLRAARMERALANLFEALPVFLTLALLAMVRGTDGGWAFAGAGVFFVGRLAYVPAYATGIPWVRSAAWAVGHVGLGMMVAGLFAG